MTVTQGRTELRRGDLDAAWLTMARAAGRVAWDIETSGLEWRSDKIGTCQIGVGSDIAVIQLDPGAVPANLRALLADPGVTKVFHHAPFDLRFMAHSWAVRPAAVACTKIAAKIVSPGREPEAYSLRSVLREYLGVEIDKSMQVSDWSRAELSGAQLDYAANDVRYLVELLGVLTARARREGVTALVEASYGYLPVRVALDVRGSGDVFAY